MNRLHTCERRQRFMSVPSLAQREARRDCRLSPPVIIPLIELLLRRWREVVKRKNMLHCRCTTACCLGRTARIVQLDRQRVRCRSINTTNTITTRSYLVTRILMARSYSVPPRTNPKTVGTIIDQFFGHGILSNLGPILFRQKNDDDLYCKRLTLRGVVAT